MSENRTNQPDTPTNGNSSPRRRPYFSRLRVRLLALVLLAILPALGLVLYTAFAQRRSGIREATASAQRLVRLAAAAQRQYVEASRQLLRTLAQLQVRRPARAEEATALFRSLAQVHSIYVNIGGIDPKGYVFASALPFTNQVYLGDRSYFQIARDTQKFAIGEYQVGRLTAKPTLNMAHPIKDREG